MRLQKVGHNWATNTFTASLTCCISVTIRSDFKAQEKKNLSPLPLFLFLFAVKWWDQMGRDAMILVFQMLSFKPAFSLSCFTLIQRLFSSSFSANRVVSSAYLRLLIFLLAILILACDSSSLAFHMMYSAHKLNKQGDNIQPCHTPFPVLNLYLYTSLCYGHRICVCRPWWDGATLLKVTYWLYS